MDSENFPSWNFCSLAYHLSILSMDFLSIVCGFTHQLCFNTGTSLILFMISNLIESPILQIENKDIAGLSFKTHPNINKESFNNSRIIGLKDPNRPFPSGQSDVGLMKWRIHGLDEAALPLTGRNILCVNSLFEFIIH